MADLRHLLAIYVHAHQTGNSVPPHIDTEARATLAAEPPAPAPAIPLDLDALLSPEGAYEPGTGQELDAQLVDQLQWWVPLHGCETLENLLDRIRGRILPHLRPPIAGIDVPGPDGDYGGLQELCDAEGVDVRIGAPLLKRAREAWGATQPPAPAPAGHVPDAGNMVAGVSKRKIIQMVVDNTSSSRCNYIYGLCNDGTILGLDDIPTGQWRILPAIPQPTPHGAPSMTDPTTTPTPPQGLTDARLLELAAREIEPYDRIPPGEYEAEYQRALEVYGSELIAAMRAAIAAHEAARPQPTPEEVEARFLAWWAESYPHAPVGSHAVASHVAFALHLLGGEVQ